MMRGMVIEMNDAKLQTLDPIRAFLDGTVPVDFAVAANERYAFVARMVRGFDYDRLQRCDKGLVLRFLTQVSGYSRQQITRWVARVGTQTPRVKRYRGSRTSFARTFTDADVRLLAQIDALQAAPCPDRPPRSSWNALGGSLPIPPISAWPRFP